MHPTNDAPSMLGEERPNSDRVLASFTESMPEAYRLRYEEADIRRHAKIVERRSGATVHVELCSTAQDAELGAQWICIVTDDRPGLLSLLSAAVAAHSLDILGARIYCRERVGQSDEVVDFFFVRRIKDPAHSQLVASDLIAIQHSIEALLRGEMDEEWLARRATPTSRPLGGPSTIVHFQIGKQGEVLVVDADDRPGLLLAVTLALHRARVRILRSNVTTLTTRAHDEFSVSEIDGQPLTESRKREVVNMLYDALRRNQ